MYPNKGLGFLRSNRKINFPNFIKLVQKKFQRHDLNIDFFLFYRKWLLFPKNSVDPTAISYLLNVHSRFNFVFQWRDGLTLR